jgi:hypothetical protein
METMSVGDVAAGQAPWDITGAPLTFLLVATGRADPALLGLDGSINVFG